MSLDLYNVSKNFIGPLPDHLTILYSVGTLVLFLVVVMLFITVLRLFRR